MTTADGATGVDETAFRNLVVCLDGTTNEPETGCTNVARLFDVAVKDERQLVYYDPGVGTLGASAAITPWGQALTRAAGMAIGYGIKDNIEQAYTWLMRNYRKGDQIYVFGFSRGAYTARALTGMLRTVGLLHPDADNMLPYALKLYAKSGGSIPDPAARLDASDEGATEADKAIAAKAKQVEKDFWKVRNDFRKRFGNPDFPDPFDKSREQVHFLGVWDTVKFVGWLNVKARLEVARWPFTANLANVTTARHALAIDERRRPFAEYRIKPEAVAASHGRFQEMWFAGVHGDIGGQNRADDQLPDIAFSWMVKEAIAARPSGPDGKPGDGLLVDARRYRRLLGAGLDEALPADRALGAIEPNAGIWRLALGWRVRRIDPLDPIHPSVYYRVDHPERLAKPYRPKNLPPRPPPSPA